MGSMRRTAAVAAAALAAVLLGGCGLSGTGAPEAGAGGLAAMGVNLSGQTITVGGKNFDEQLFLCKAQIAALQSVGATVVDRCNIPGSAAARTALTSGDVDMYWSYTGTGWVIDLGRTPPIPDARAQYEAVRDADAANGIVWTRPASFDNTYAIGTTRAFADANGIRSVSDFARFVDSADPRATLCVESEFSVRPDGLSGMKQAYGITGPLSTPPQLVALDTGAIYRAVAEGRSCTFGEISSTDGRIPGLGLVALPDDRGFFPKYTAANTIRRSVVDRAPGVVTVSDEIAKRLDYATILDLNGRISSQGQDPDAVAREWLRRQGLVG